MKRIIWGTLIVALALMACQGKHDSAIYSKEVANLPKVQNEIKKITVYESTLTTFAPLRSNTIIDDMARYECMEYFELTDESDRLFGDLQRLLAETTVIDSAIFVGSGSKVSKHVYVWVKDDVDFGYVVRYDNKTITVIPTYSKYYNYYKGRLFNNIPHDKFVGVPLFLTIMDCDNDIEAECVILYQYKDVSIPNDTICYGYLSNFVRLNSHLATANPVLLETVVDSIKERFYPHSSDSKNVQHTTLGEIFDFDNTTSKGIPLIIEEEE